MKRPNQEDSQDASGRGKHARLQGQAAAASGSHTILQPTTLLALQPHAYSDDMAIDDGLEIDHDDSTSMDEDLDDDSDTDTTSTNQVLTVSQLETIFFAY